VILDDLCDKLSSGSIGLTSGTNLFADEWPDAPDTAAVVAEAGGYAPVHAMSASPGQAVAERPRVQVLTRAPKYRSARQLMHNIVQTLDGLNNTTINGTRYLQIVAVSSPTTMGVDASGRKRCVCNLDVIKALHTSTST